MKNKTCLIIAGPTAVGKTSLSIEIAKILNTEIISADSRQCYQEMNIGVARPSPQELAAVPHHFINNISVHDNFTAADYENFALKKLNEIFLKSDFSIVTGGTGLYIKALTDGLDAIPAIPENIRNEVKTIFEKDGIVGLQNRLLVAEALPAHLQNIQNPQRLMRALEVLLTTGNAIETYQKNESKQRSFAIKKIFINLPRAQLYQNINHRVEQMMQNGLLEEAKKLYAYKQLNALQTVGYKELFLYFDAVISLNQAVELIKQHTRHYAKRQITWFNKIENMHYCNADVSALKTLVTKLISTP